MYNEHDTFRLRLPLPGQTIPVGALGVVLMVFFGEQPEYEVEFPDGKGGNLGTMPTFTIGEQFMEPTMPQVEGDQRGQAGSVENNRNCTN
jgi:hypothetical protein